MNQINMIFGTEPHKLVRTRDPETSHIAAHAVDSGALEKLVYDTICSFPAGCIQDEVLEALPNKPYSSVTARFRALLDKKLIETVGRRSGRSGKPQRVIRATKIEEKS